MTAAAPGTHDPHQDRPGDPPRQPPRRPPRRSPGETLARHNTSLGARGEAEAADHLVAGGMVVLDRNWRCDAGEIDLVLREGRTLVICEVKTRSSLRYGSPLEAVDERKAARLRRLAARWMACHDVRPDDVRIDLVGVLMPGSARPEIDHVRGVA